METGEVRLSSQLACLSVMMVDVLLRHGVSCHITHHEHSGVDILFAPLCRRKSSQWFVLTRPHAEIIAADTHFIVLFKQHCRPHFNSR